MQKEGIPKYFKPHPPKDQESNFSSQNKCPNSQETCPKDQEMCPKGQDKCQKTCPDGQEKHCNGQDTQAASRPKNQDKCSHPKSQVTASKPLPSSARVECLAEKAADLSISASESTKMQRRALPHHIEKEEAEVRRSPRIRAKRVRSVMDEVREYPGYSFPYK